MAKVSKKMKDVKPNEKVFVVADVHAVTHYADRTEIRTMDGIVFSRSPEETVEVEDGK